MATLPPDSWPSQERLGAKQDQYLLSTTTPNRKGGGSSVAQLAHQFIHPRACHTLYVEYQLAREESNSICFLSSAFSVRNVWYLERSMYWIYVVARKQIIFEFFDYRSSHDMSDAGHYHATCDMCNVIRLLSKLIYQIVCRIVPCICI